MTTEPPPAKRLSTREVYVGRLLRVRVDTIETPAGQTVELEMVRHPGAAAIVPLLSPLDSIDPQVLLIRQYRYAADGFLWEVPAGVLEPGEDPEACARRELQEETGAEAEVMRHLTSIFTTPGFTDERIHLFLATGLTMSQPDLEPDELITVQPHSISTLLQMIRDGEIVDSKSITALLYVAGFILER